MKVELVSYTVDPLGTIMKATAECYEKEPALPRVIGCIKNGHHSVLEHASFTFRVDELSRAASHQLVRHRISSYSQKSQRYVSEDNFQYVVPPSIQENEEAKKVFEETMITIKEAYGKLRSLDIKKEDARYVLPNACTTHIIFTMNLRSLLNFWNLRCDKRAQWEIREIAYETLDIVLKILPELSEAILDCLNR
jgi:thymidylate synthase (FAD)